MPVVAILTVLAAAASGAADEKASWYVATNGNDSWSGKLPEPNATKTDGPFATLAKARDSIRALKGKEGKDPLKEPVTVMVRGGKYFLDKPLSLTAADSGSRECPVTYMAYPGENPILSGGVKLTSWTTYKGSIVKAVLPEPKADGWRFRQLFFDGKRQIRSRYPNLDSKNPLYGGWLFMEGPAEPESASAFIYKPDTFKRHWAKPTQGEVNVYSYVGWVNDIIPIKSVDEKNRVITLCREVSQWDRPPWYIRVKFNIGNRFIVENLLEELDEPGEWCLDWEENAVYFWPPWQLTKDSEVVIPKQDSLIDLRASWTNIQGLTFTETADGDDFQREGWEGYGAMLPHQGLKYCGEAVHLRNADHCRIEDNKFDQVGGNAVYLEGKNERNIISGNEIAYAGANGICMIGCRDQHPMLNRVEDNDIHHCGVYNKYVEGVFCGLSEMNVIGHNSIHDMPHSAIHMGSRGMGRNIIEYNDIRRVALEIQDTAAINSWMEDPGTEIRKEGDRSGNIVRYNYIADTSGCRVDEKGNIHAPDHISPANTHGIYMDTCTSNCVVYGNIIVRSGTRAILLQGGKNNIIENNIIVDCQSPMAYSDIVAHWFAPQMAGFMTGNRFSRNIFYCTRTDGRLYELYFMQYANGVWENDRTIQEADYNLFFYPGGQKYQVMFDPPSPDLSKVIPLAQWQRMGFDEHSITADPMFVDSTHDNYRLKPESPAFKLGFQQIDVTQIGPRKRLKMQPSAQWEER